MKTILVIDKPEDCHQCPLFYVEGDGYYGYYACVHKDIVYQDVGDYEQPKHCILKPLPQSINPYMKENSDYLDRQYINGWNDCLDEIIGGEKND